MWNRSRLHYLWVHAFRWLDDATAFIQFIAETLVSIRGRVSILRASLGGARQKLVFDSLQHALNLSRVKRLGNEGHAAQVPLSV